MSTNVTDFAKQIQDFLLLLTQKERYVIERRFNLDKKERATLEEIGNQYSVTRERIRQIEKNALNKLKRNIDNAPLSEISDQAFRIIKENGGVMKEDILISKLINQGNDYYMESLQLILSIDKRFKRIPNTVNYYPFVRFNEYEENKIYQATKNAVNLLKKNLSTMSLVQIHKAINGQKGIYFDELTLSSILKIDKKIKYINDEKVGLIEWREINPRTLRDKIYFILRSQKNPMHFIEIANRIIEENFDKKKINLQAVHNELIRHPDFVLIGRGIYGLGEWGYVPGTVAEIIEKMLNENGEMSQDEIISEVLKQRKVKPITIILSLKNKENFVRVGRKQYALARA
ncbi:hypothetical protein GF376_00095 [Candidatus Peregrinibacteria bacterium]|nr:hypothetical protein [Candidatus Peregrinibacteria bacterium]